MQNKETDNAVEEHFGKTIIIDDVVVCTVYSLSMVSMRAVIIV